MKYRKDHPAAPPAQPAVNGHIVAKEVKVKADISVPDYVFGPDYRLPEIPSASDIERDGLDLAEMNLLLKKEEELSLHLIEKDKKRREQDERIGQLEKLLAGLLEDKQ